MILANGGSGLLDQYDGGLYPILKALLPSHDWKIWRFPRQTSASLIASSPLRKKKKGKEQEKGGEKDDNKEVEKGKEKELLKMVADLEELLKIKSVTDWHRIKRSQFAEFGIPRALISKNGPLHKALKIRYPDESWGDLALISSTSSTSAAS